jgi:hypothetical protein
MEEAITASLTSHDPQSGGASSSRTSTAGASRTKGKGPEHPRADSLERLANKVMETASRGLGMDTFLEGVKDLNSADAEQRLEKQEITPKEARAAFTAAQLRKNYLRDVAAGGGSAWQARMNKAKQRITVAPPANPIIDNELIPATKQWVLDRLKERHSANIVAERLIWECKAPSQRIIRNLVQNVKDTLEPK